MMTNVISVHKARAYVHLEESVLSFVYTLVNLCSRTCFCSCFEDMSVRASFGHMVLLLVCIKMCGYKVWVHICDKKDASGTYRNDFRQILNQKHDPERFETFCLSPRKDSCSDSVILNLWEIYIVCTF